jgi:hypothetical protein
MQGGLTWAESGLDWSREQMRRGLPPLHSSENDRDSEARQRWEEDMLNRMPFAAVLLTATCGSALGLVCAYRVDPVKASWSGWTHSGDTVAQTLTCNFDSPTYVELFVGGIVNGDAYNLDVRDGSTGDRVAHKHNVSQRQDHSWVRFDTLTLDAAFTKGKQYEFRFTRSGQDSMQYYYQSGNPYDYGLMVVPGQNPVPLTWDLACRVYGRMNPVDSTWRGCVNHWTDPAPENGGIAALAKADSIGIRWIREDFGHWMWWYNWPTAVMDAYDRYVSDSFNLMGVLCYGRGDSAAATAPPESSTSPNLFLYPPRNLWPDSGQTNYWADYCRSIMESMPAVKYWEIWPEANARWGWRDPDIAYYQDGDSGPIDTPRERCSLYVRMCCIADNVAHALGGETLRKVIGGATYRLLDNDGGVHVSSGVDWLRDMCDMAEHRYGGVENCFDIASVHAYMHVVDAANPGAQMLWFDDTRFTKDLDTARWALRQAGYPGMELWATEYGWPRWSAGDTVNPPPLTDTLMQARNLCQFYASAIGRQTDPRGGYDRASWYELTGYRGFHYSRIMTEGYGLLDTCPNQPRLPHSWAFSQVGDKLTGKRCNGRVMTGNTATDSLVRMYEFEDTSGKRTWVCWTNGATKKRVGVKVPVRTNNLAAESLAYSRTPPAFSSRVANDGWLSLNLNPRPVFVSEKAAPQRPDLRVDSVRVVRMNPGIVRAWVTNHGTRATPIRSRSHVPYPTWAVLRADGDSLTDQVQTTSVAADQQVVFEFDLGQTQLPDTVLFSVTVNPSQTYVELGTDDNTGYVLAVRP